MNVPRHSLAALACALALVLAASPSHAQLEDQLSAYTGVNAEGYLAPLVDAFGSDLNGGLFHSAYIPRSGPRVRFEIKAMAVIFGDEDRMFRATTESGFSPEQTVDAPTVVGDGGAVTVNGTAGTTFAFPGGFDLNSFTIAVPQLRIGSVAGTEALIRFFAIDTGDAELGDIQLFGIGARHSISQYLGDEPPLDVAVGFFWQKFEMGDDLIDSSAFSIGAQASKRFGIVEPFGGLSFDSFGMDVTYDSDASGSTTEIDLNFDTDTTVHLTLGVGVNLAFVHGFFEYNVADQNSFGFGLAFGN